MESMPISANRVFEDDVNDEEPRRLFVELDEHRSLYAK